MKKKLLFLSAIVLTVLLITGCGGGTKVLKCSINSTQSGINYTQDMEATFTGNKVTKVYMEMAFDISGYPESYRESIGKSMKQTYENTYDKPGSTVKVETKGDNVLVYIDMDLEKMSQADKNALNFGNQYGSYEATKKEFESIGYTCR